MCGDRPATLTDANTYHVTLTATKGEITKTKAIVANGKNLAFNAAWGDSVTVSRRGKCAGRIRLVKGLLRYFSIAVTSLTS